MTELQQRIAALSPEQRAMLEKRVADLAAARAAGPGGRIAPRDRERPTPLSIQQQREWTFNKVRQANNIPAVFRVDGALDPDLASRVLTKLVERHEVLRSTVEQQPDGTRVQVVHPVTPVPIPVVDLSHLTEDEQRVEVRRRWFAEVETAFPAEQHQRLRITVARMADRTHVVFMTTEHAASDLASMGILVREFAALYVGAHLDPLEIQFGDYADWQREVEKQRMAAEMEHWRQTLAGIPAGLALPTDRAYPARPSFSGAIHYTDLSPELAEGLRR